MATLRSVMNWTPPKAKTWSVDGWRGMYDSRANVQGPDEAALLINLMPSDLLRPGPVYLRPGRQPLANLGTAPRLGDGSHVVQWIGEVSLTNGGTRVIAVADGEIFEVNVATGAITERVSTANLTTASITLSTTAACHCIEFDGTLVVAAHGAANAPFTWNGTANGGLTKLTNAPTSVLGVTAYYAKLFFIKSDGITIAWSEELQANTGYEAGGHNNAWELTQTSNEPLSGILGTNDGLYYGRKTSVGIIRGAVSSTFQTDGVHDGVSIGSGPDSSALFAHMSGTLFWMDFKGNVFAYQPGTEVAQISAQLPRIYGHTAFMGHASNYQSLPAYGVGEEDMGNLNPAMLVADQASQRIYAEFSGVLGGRWVQVYDAKTLKLLCLWDYGTANDRTISAFPTAFRFACTGRISATATHYVYADGAGYVFQQLLASATTIAPTADYTEAGVGTAITGTMIGPEHGHGHRVEWQFDQLDVETDELPANAVSVGYITSRFHKASLTPADQAASNSGVTSTPYKKHRAFGLGRDASGRFLRPIIQITGSTSTTSGNQPPQIFGYTLTGYPVSTSPGVT